MGKAQFMEFRIVTPCDDCPFRSDIRPYLTPGRVLDLERQLEHHTFSCHKTVYAPQPRSTNGRFAKKVLQHCAGALILMEKSKRLGDLQQIAERLGLYNPSIMNLNAPVYESFAAMYNATVKERA